MKRTSVTSSQIVSIGYDEEKQILEVEFKSWGNNKPTAIYQYFDVQKEKYNALMSAESHGKYLNTEILKGGYKYTHVEL